MADLKLTALTEDTNPSLTDVIYTIKDPGGTPLDRKVTLSSIKTLVIGTDIIVADGGTGVSTLADGGLVCGNGTGAVEVVAAGATTEILVGGGASTAPVWTTANGTGAPVRTDAATMTTFTSTGIDDNAASMAVTIDSSQRVLIGDTVSRVINGANAPLQVNGTTAEKTTISLMTSSATDSTQPQFMFAKNASGTAGTYTTAIASGELLGRMQWYGSDTTDMATIGAEISAVAADTWAENSGKTSLFFKTNGGAASPTERMNILSDGRVEIGSVSAPTNLGLTVKNNSQADGIWTATFENAGTNATSDGVLITIGVVAANTDNRFISFSDGSSTIGGIVGNGTGINYVDTSDARMKDNIRDTALNGLDTVNAIRVVDYEGKKDGSPAIANLIAQELAQVFKEATANEPNETETYEAERARGNIVEEVTEEILPADAFEDIEVDEVTEVVDKIEKIKKLNLDGTVTEVDKPKYKTKKVTKRQLKEGVRFDEKTGKVYQKKEVIVEADVDQRDYNRNKKDLGRWVKTKDPVMGTRPKMMGVSRERLVPVLVKAIQEMDVKDNVKQALIESMSGELSGVITLIQELNSRLEALEAR